MSQRTYLRLLKKLKRCLSDRDYGRVYENAESLFVGTGFPIFFYLCLDCFHEVSNIGKDIVYLLKACKHTALREFLRGIFFSTQGKTTEARLAFRASLSADSARLERLIPLYVISMVEDDPVAEVKKTKILDAAKDNLRALEIMERMGLANITFKPIVNGG